MTASTKVTLVSESTGGISVASANNLCPRDGMEASKIILSHLLPPPPSLILKNRGGIQGRFRGRLTLGRDCGRGLW